MQTLKIMEPCGLNITDSEKSADFACLLAITFGPLLFSIFLFS